MLYTDAMVFIIVKDLLATIATIVLFYVIGASLLRILRVSLFKSEQYIFSTGFGLIALTFISYILSWLGIRSILHLIVLGLIVFFFINRKSISVIHDKEKFFDIWSIVFLIVSSLVFLIPNYSSGDFGPFISLLGVHDQDSALHVSMINELIYRFPPTDLGFAGNRLTAYHFFYNYSASIIAILFRVSAETVHFRIFPILLSILWPWTTFLIGKRLFRSSITALFIVFFTMFGASFSMFITWFYHIPISFNSGFGILQPPVSLLNPPYASSVVVLLLAIYSLIRFDESKLSRWLFPVAIFFGMLIEYKVYAGIVGLGGLGVYVLLNLKKYHWKIALTGLIALAIAFGIYWPFTGSSGFLFDAKLWAPHEIARASLPFLRYDNAISEYARLFDPIRPILLEIKVLLYFIIGNLGLRVFGIIALIILLIKQKEKRAFMVTMGVMTVVSFYIPLMYMQSLKPYEISQMFNYTLLLLSFPTGYFFSWLVRKVPKGIGIVVALVVLGFSLPQFIQADYKDFFMFPRKTIVNSEYAMYKNIRNNNTPRAVLLEMPQEGALLKDIEKWFRYRTTLRFSAFGNTQAFLAFTNLIYSESEVKKRAVILNDLRLMDQEFLSPVLTIDEKQKKLIEMKKILSPYNITYVYSSYALDGLLNSGLISPFYISPPYFVYKLN